MTPSEAVELARQMREAGAVRFTFQDGRLSCVLRPPDPKPETEIIERIREMQPEQRKELLDEARKDYDRDLYGAAT